MSSSNFVQNLESKLHRSGQTLVLAEGDDERILEAAKTCINTGICNKILLLTELCEKSNSKLANILSGADLNTTENLHFLHTRDPGLILKTKDFLIHRFQSRGKELENKKAEQMAGLATYQACFLIANGAADAGVAGAVFPTAEVIRAGIHSFNLAQDNKTVSSCFLFERPEGEALFFSDCGVLVAPSPEQRVDIASQTVSTAKALFSDHKPVVAFLSFSTAESAAHPLQKEMAESYRLFKTKFPSIEAAGEVQFDAAFDLSILKRKAPAISLTKPANTFIFPDLNSGNIAYKIANKLAGLKAYGPILQGFSKSWTDLSRGASVEEIYVSCLIALSKSAAEK